MKHILLILILLTTNTFFAQQDSINVNELKQGMQELQGQLKSALNYYDKYEKNTTDQEKKQAFDAYVDKISGDEKVSEKDKQDAFKIVDAYIKADSDPKQAANQEQYNLENDSEIKEQAQEYINQAENRLMNMSYNEYETYLLQVQPLLSKREIKESFNQLHKNDSKYVQINVQDDELTKDQIQFRAMEQLNNAKTYYEYKKAMKIIYPNVSEEEIKKSWEYKQNH